MLGHISFMGFVAMWNPGDSPRWSAKTRYFLGGFIGGTALLFDYSGVLFLLALFIYGIVKTLTTLKLTDANRHGYWYVLGTLGRVSLL